MTMLDDNVCDAHSIEVFYVGEGSHSGYEHLGLAPGYYYVITEGVDHGMIGAPVGPFQYRKTCVRQMLADMPKAKG